MDKPTGPAPFPDVGQKSTQAMLNVQKELLDEQGRRSKDGRTLVDATLENDISRLQERPASEWATLIRKLRWIGMDNEAQRLERAVSTLPPEQRGSVSAGSFATD